MPQISIDMHFDQLLAIGIDGATRRVGLSVATGDTARPTLGFTIPSEQLAYYIVRLKAAAARIAQLEARERGATMAQSRAAMERHAFRVTGAGFAARRPGRDSVVLFLSDDEMAALPVELTLDAARALVASLSELI